MQKDFELRLYGCYLTVICLSLFVGTVYAKIVFCTREKKKRGDSIEFTQKLVSSLIASIILQPQNVASLTWCFTCFRKSKNQHPPPPPSYMMTWNWRASGGFPPFSFRKIYKRNMFYLCYLEMHFVYFTSYGCCILLYDWWQKFVYVVKIPFISITLCQSKAYSKNFENEENVLLDSI